MSFNPDHGGALSAAAEYFEIPKEDWVDISTGINPVSWPIPEIPASVWQRLPENQPASVDNIQQAALQYYARKFDGTLSVSQENILSCSGSQQGIRLLPQLFKKQHSGDAKIWVTSGSYSEHGRAWEEQGYRVGKVACDRISQLLTQQPVDVLVLINPDNPSGHRWTAEQLLKWWSILHRRGGWLIIDEAFMDMTPALSLVNDVERDGLFVLRSVGKFFGLAGIRLGFIFAAEKNIRQLSKIQGPWAVSHPSQYIGNLALRDFEWIDLQYEVLAHQSLRLALLLKKYMSLQCEGTDLFKTVYCSDANRIFKQLAKQGVLVRYLAETSKSKAGLRFGLLDNEEHWQRLEAALKLIS